MSDGRSGGRRYRLGPLERRGMIAGWRGGQIAVAAAGLGLAFLVVGAHPGPLELVGGLGAAGTGLAAGWWPVAGRTTEQWVPVVTRWAATSRRVRTADAVRAGHCTGPDGRACLAVAFERAGARGVTSERRGPWAGLAIASVTVPGGEEIGLVCDRRLRTYSAAVRVRGHSFALLGAADKERRVGGWASVLTALARHGSVVHRVQWVVSTVPDDGEGVVGYVSERAVLDGEDAARRSYAALIDGGGSETCRHDVLLVLQLRVAGAGGRAVRAAGGGDRGAGLVLWRELGALRRQLEGADVPVERMLDARAMAAVIRQVGRSHPGACPPCGVGWPWPVAAESSWGWVRTDGTFHVTYWVAEWPRSDVEAEFLGPLLLGTQRRTVAVVMEPVDPARALREVERSRTADAADAELRRRGGFLATARRAREVDMAARREGELADGHASYRFAGYVTVSVAERTQLEAACEMTEQAAAQCGLELRRLYGEQELALSCTLPLARGLS